MLRQLHHSGELDKLLGVVCKQTCTSAIAYQQDEISLQKVQLIAIIAEILIQELLKSEKNGKR